MKIFFSKFCVLIIGEESETGSEDMSEEFTVSESSGSGSEDDIKKKKKGKSKQRNINKNKVL